MEIDCCWVQGFKQVAEDEYRTVLYSVLDEATYLIVR